MNGTTTAIATDPATNRLANLYFDANGNLLTGAGLTMAYDGANRLASAAPASGGVEYYGYSPDNKRVYRVPASGVEEWTLYGIQGENLGTYHLSTALNGMPAFRSISTNVWFAGKMVSENATGVNPFGTSTAYNRLGTAAGLRVYPYGEEIGTPTANGSVKYGTYYRDGFTGLDYAQQRYYASSLGRFNTADRYNASAAASDPGSWNRYSYVHGDPVNYNDQRGTDACFVSGGPCQSVWSPYGAFNACDPQVGYTLAVMGYNDPDNSWSNTFDQYMMSSGSCSGGAAGPEPPPTASTPTCSISLYERPVPNEKSFASHAYFSVTSSEWSTGLLIEGGPTGNPVSSSLFGYDTHAPGQGLGAGTASASNPALPSNKQIGTTYSGPSACDAINYLTETVNGYDSGKLATYNFLAIPCTYNSNSFVYTLLSDLNSIAFGGVLSAFGQQAPGSLPGWGKKVPGL